MAVINGITVYELGRQGDLTEFASTTQPPGASKAYLVPNWNDRYTVANGILFKTTLAGGAGGSIIFTRPMSYPDSPNLTAMSIRIQGVGAIYQGPNQIAWTSAIVSTEFGRLPYQSQQNQDPGGLNSFDPSAPLIYASQSLRKGAQSIEVKGGICKLADGTVLQQPYSRLVGVNTLSLTLHQMPYLPTTGNRAVIGSINQYAIFGAGVGTLRLDAFDTSVSFLSDGTPTQEVTMAFAERPEAAWDKILHPNGTSGWTQVQYNGASILPIADFANLVPTAYYGSGS